MKPLHLAVATALYLGATAVSAATLSISPANSTAQPGAGNPTSPTTITVQYDNTGYAAGNGDSIDADVIYDATKLSVTVTGNCNGGTPGDVIIAAADGASNSIASGPICTMTFTTLAGAALGNVIALDLQNVNVSSNGVTDPIQPVVTDGTITISAAPPANAPILTFAPPGGTVVSGGSFSITPSSGQAGGSAAYTCTPSAGVVLTNGAGTINTGGAAVSVGATCSAAGPDGSVACTHTGFAGSTASPVNFVIDCPLAPAPVLASTPANGTTLTCNGTPGSAVTTQATIQNTGNANMTGVSCTVAGASFVLTTAPTPIIAGGSSSNAVVTCTVPAANAPAATGTLSCTTTAPAGGALSFPLSSSGAVVVPAVAILVPASSLWSKIGLIGLLAALGMLMVGFRRHQ